MIAVIGAGYVGLSLAVLFAQKHWVNLVDIDAERVGKINQGVSPIADQEIEAYLPKYLERLTATTDTISGCRGAKYVVITVPTNYDSERNFFDTSIVESVLQLVVPLVPDATIVIKSTLPVGYTKKIRERFAGAHILFSSEFLRESHALEDNFNTDPNHCQC